MIIQLHSIAQVASGPYVSRYMTWIHLSSYSYAQHGHPCDFARLYDGIEVEVVFTACGVGYSRVRLRHAVFEGIIAGGCPIDD